VRWWAKGARSTSFSPEGDEVSDVRPLIFVDVDWAPDAAVEDMAIRLAEADVRSTWFLTHESPVNALLRSRPDLFELGIHPNFLPGSDHGSTTADVLRFCMELVPEARGMRTHGLVQSTALLTEVAATTPIGVDASLLLPRASHLTPVEMPTTAGTLTRVPCFWEDDVEMLNDKPWWSLSDIVEGPPGLRACVFHPIHVWLNTADFTQYQAFKRRHGRLTGLSPAITAERRSGPGPGQLFGELVSHLRDTGASHRLADLAKAERR
jgi:hypothetical protein